MLVDKNNKGVSPLRELLFFHAKFAKKEKNLIIFVNQHGKPRIQEKSELAGVLPRELKKMPILLST